MSVICPRAAKHEAFTQMRGASGLQFSHMTEVLPSNNLEIGSICWGYGYQGHYFKVLVSYEYSHA